ncbi:MAG: hypothetical protein ACTHKT_01670 [Solirubrobacterales bacterium]
MTTREKLHRIVGELPEEELDVIYAVWIAKSQIERPSEGDLPSP